MGTAAGTDLGTLREALIGRRSQLDQRVGSRRTLQQQLEQATKDRDEALARLESLAQVRLILEKLTDAKRELVRTKIEALVTTGVRTVFGEGYTFRIDQTMARNVVNFHYRILHEFDGETRESGLRDFHGGGLVALVGFLLRVVMVLFTRPARRRLVVLDETMAALDGDKRAPFSKLLATLADQLDMQFLLVTHSPEYSTDADVTYVIKQTAPGCAVLVRQD